MFKKMEETNNNKCGSWTSIKYLHPFPRNTVVQEIIKAALSLTIVYLCLTSQNRKVPRRKSELFSCVDTLFSFGFSITSVSKVYHFSLNIFLTEKERNNKHESELMKYEWARYESFKTFPEECPVSPLRLAQSGFYYSGKGLGATCFKCGLKNSFWSEAETVSDTHKRIAPDCPFVNGIDTDNVPIHEDVTRTGNSIGGACGGPGEMVTPLTTPSQTHQTSNNTVNWSRSNQSTEYHLEHRSHETTEDVFNRNPNGENTETSSDTTNFTGRSSENVVTTEIERFPGIVNERPKHPDYAIKNVRMASYRAWAFTDILDPETLADAGFFFVGTQDCVRCFFCGGGVKSWEYGDCPWIEHARWFPECAYVKQCKGEDFVNMCRMSHIGIQTHNLTAQQTTMTEDQLITDLNSIAAKRVLDMGFGQTDVEDAIKHTRRQLRSTEELKAEHLLQYLLDNEYTRYPGSASTLRTGALENHASVAGDNQHRQTSDQAPSHSSEENTNVAVDESHTEINAESSSSGSKKGAPTAKEDGKLKEENRQLKERMMCKICMDKDANIVFLPCGHLVSCVECAHALRKCAVCRKVIQGTVRAYPA